MMRTTLDIDPDILQAVKSLADDRRTTAGKVLSDLARAALTTGKSQKSRKRNGFTLLPAKKDGKVVTLELINRLRDDEE
jgi:hypothetical protein